MDQGPDLDGDAVGGSSLPDEASLQWLVGRDSQLINRAAVEFDFPADALRVLGAARALGALLAQYEASLWRTVGLTSAQGWLVTKLLLAGPAGQSEIAGDLMVSRSSVSQLADRLESMGLVERTPSAEDRRVSLLSLTEEGRAKVFEVLPTIRTALVDIGRRLGSTDMRSLVEEIEQLSGAVSSATREALPEA